jgi:hypothetical protein
MNMNNMYRIRGRTRSFGGETLNVRWIVRSPQGELGHTEMRSTRFTREEALEALAFAKANFEGVYDWELLMSVSSH